ncbi:MAG: pilus assembly protein PilM [Deltaproteobacteria bacterium]|nr:pilus assembly protein PilM [Deltaproteobacteria bacterium]
MYFQASVGISIESNCIALVCLKRSFKGLSLAAHAIHPIKKENPEEKTAEVRKFVNEFLREHRIASADIFLGIQRDLTILRYIELPLAVKENLKGTLSYEMEKYVPFPVNDIYFDCQIIEEDKEANKLKVLLIGVKKEFIDPYLDRETPLGAGISGMEINSTAWVNYFSYKPNTPNADTYAIACLGSEHLELSLVKKKLLNYSRHVKIDQKGGGVQRLALEELELLMKTLGPEQGRLEVLLCGPDADRRYRSPPSRAFHNGDPVGSPGAGLWPCFEGDPKDADGYQSSAYRPSEKGQQNWLLYDVCSGRAFCPVAPCVGREQYPAPEACVGQAWRRAQTTWRPGCGHQPDSGKIKRIRE